MQDNAPPGLETIEMVGLGLLNLITVTFDLQRSRQRLVTARAEERRDLHDGLGPQLASHVLKLEAARELVRTNPARAESLLANLIEKSQGIVSEVRRLVYDLRPPGLNGIEATRRVLHGSPHIAILMLTMFEDDDSVFAAVRAGARGYILKGALKAEIFRAIRGVSHGEAIFGPAIARKLMNYFAAPHPPAPPQTFPELTDREREILAMMAQHLTNSEIAERLSISQKTVRNQVSNILSKLQVSDRAQAIIRAREAGLGKNS